MSFSFSPLCRLLPQTFSCRSVAVSDSVWIHVVVALALLARPNLAILTHGISVVSILTKFAPGIRQVWPLGLILCVIFHI